MPSKHRSISGPSVSSLSDEFSLSPPIIRSCTTTSSPSSRFLMRASISPEPQPIRRDATYARYSGANCPLACETIINYVSFNDTDPLLSWKVNACRSTFRITSLYLCLDEFCKRDGAISAWIQTQNHSCIADANVTLPSLSHVLNQWQPDDRDRLEKLTAAKALSFPSVDNPVLPEDALLDRAFITVVRHRPVHIKIAN